MKSSNEYRMTQNPPPGFIATRILSTSELEIAPRLLYRANSWRAPTSGYLLVEKTNSFKFVGDTDIFATARFRTLAQQWRAEAELTSSMSRLFSHPAYLEIIAMGEKAIRPILEDLARSPTWWFVALEAITRQDPARHVSKGNLNARSEAWLEWGRHRGILP